MIRDFKKVKQGAIETFFRDSHGINEHQDFPRDKIDRSGDDCIGNPINDIIQKNQPIDENPVKNSQIPDETAAIAINDWDKLSDDFAEKILTQAIKSSDYVCQTYSNITNSRSRFQIIEKKGNRLLPCIYIKPYDDIKKSFNGKTKVSVWKLLTLFGQGSGLIMRAAELIGNNNWKSAWLELCSNIRQSQLNQGVN